VPAVYPSRATDVDFVGIPARTSGGWS